MKRIYSFALLTSLILNPVSAQARDYSFDFRPLVAFAAAPYAICAVIGAGCLAYNAPQAFRNLRARVGTQNLLTGAGAIAATGGIAFAYVATREESKEAKLMKIARMEKNKEAALREKCCVHCEHRKLAA